MGIGNEQTYSLGLLWGVGYGDRPRATDLSSLWSAHEAGFMKVSRRFVGRMVEITWLDPGARRVPKQSPHAKGKAALAIWRDRGVLDDFTDGVLRIVHSDACFAGGIDEPDEIFATWVPEDLVESVVLFNPEPTTPDPPPVPA